MLQDRLFYISSQGVPEEGEKGTENAVYTVCLNPDHSVYAAHFPGNPITPGACLVQMCVEILSHHTGRELVLSGLTGVKFLHPLRPVPEKEIFVGIAGKREERGYSANLTIKDAETVFARMKLICRKGN